ncbi:FAD-binding domain-containing protein [Bimuria novae-zelandiae CBS 107.79]|uniref:FAD-binding domain-containing protein n=1 Tax=Bimuria novae-zelandiae CBS 107.79 TaxID=1447943 RepID=A0A6A5W095_9PLEO|nr:FAD-binding domain-containing protein [Bimuria novae-zelandiae CBS 107.79]
MRVLSLISLGAIVTRRAFAQSEFEPADFNATEALLANGVDASILLSLEDKLEGAVSARTTACATAVSLRYHQAFHHGRPLVLVGATRGSDASGTFKPTSALEISTLVLLSRLTQCPFAVKGGGHAAFKGASSIDGGITVSLERLNKVQALSNGVASVGAGSHWYDVYTTLEKFNLAVVGGRASSVGVSGLTLGGGISHHTNIRGFACDNVAEYELVTASGMILHVTQKSFPDLYWALRGGGPNFGIVTNFQLETFSQALFCGRCA